MTQLEKLFEIDPLLRDHENEIRKRYDSFEKQKSYIDEMEGGIDQFSRAYETHGMHFNEDNSVYCKEWAPGAHQLYLYGDFNNWNSRSHPFTKIDHGKWELTVAADKDGSCPIEHGTKVKILIEKQDGGTVDRLSPWATYVRQPGPGQGFAYDQIVWNPVWKYAFKHEWPSKPTSLRIYECHVGIASAEAKICSYAEFTANVMPRIVKLGYNAIQLMAVMEHVYYASFGYHVTNFFAVSSRFGNPEELKELIDVAHSHGLLVLLDLVHSHASKNVLDGLNQFDSTDTCFFLDGARGEHALWDSRMFNYSLVEVKRFLLSNLRWYVHEYRIDGFRFDAVTAIMYHSRGLGHNFSGDYNEYFGPNADVDAIVYLMLANDMLRTLHPHTVTVAEDASGMPALCRPVSEGGIGFDYRLALAIPNKWIELMKEPSDENWSMADIVRTMTNRRRMEKTISYVESHDESLVGGKSIAFWLMDKEMYTNMSVSSETTLVIDRGMALHKIMRLLTHSLGGEGYLNFIGNEFGHPEWLDFPRDANNHSHNYARRQWHLVDDQNLRYKYLNAFDTAMNEAEQRYGWLHKNPATCIRTNEANKIISFERAGLIFVFNFHCNTSFARYQIGTRAAGRYRIVFDSDQPEFGGYGRLDRNTDHHTFNQEYDGCPHSLIVYAPCRCALILSLQ